MQSLRQYPSLAVNKKVYWYVMETASNEENCSSVRKTPLLDYKYIDLSWSPYSDFFKRLTYDFGQKL